METNWLHNFLAWDLRAPQIGVAEVKTKVAAAIEAGIVAVVVSPHHVSVAARAAGDAQAVRESNATASGSGDVNAAAGGSGDVAALDDDSEETPLSIIAAVGFPTGRHHILVKASEARLAISQGAHRIWASLDSSNTDQNAMLSELISLREAVPYPAQLGVIVAHNAAEVAHNATEIARACELAKVDQLVVVPPENHPSRSLPTPGRVNPDARQEASSEPGAGHETGEVSATSAMLQLAQKLPDHTPVVLDAGAGKPADWQEGASADGAGIDSASADGAGTGSSTKQAAEHTTPDTDSLSEWLLAESADLAGNRRALAQAKTAKNILAVIPAPH